MSTFAERFWWCAPDKRPTPEQAKPKSGRLVRLPNGLRLPLTWYKPPNFRSHGSMTRNEIKAMDRAYRDWLIERNKRAA
jgi:hypothetical protein